ncbi:M10 family metallopeptidase C-terminal domain-containing protein [Qipengyuania sp. G39]|uniref:M10 family metallopeptidase C-terminal domain-containing protein n=1 Tax=Qipengyuania profundimaris TaxID=3067652 RepID=A0ABT9HRA7_9SPHN|nr:M10 family metallopeptidase C-terminal domain-containing protein [Qipengyuania sp. G39]MDP4575540.1 M10 family metallopeptidase C-terminal domain-containing protein [Qipengyuania sp. G39]
MYQDFYFNQWVGARMAESAQIRLANMVSEHDSGGFLSSGASLFALSSDPAPTFEITHSQACSCSSCCGSDEKATGPTPAGDEPVFVAGDIAGDTSTTATITVGGSLTSELETVGDTDWVAITLTAGQTIDISLFGSGANPVGDTYLRVRDSSGNIVAFNDDADGLNSALTFTATGAGTYYIEVDSYLSSYTGEYTLTVDEGVPPEPLDVYTYDEIAVQLTQTYWGGSARSWDVGADGSITVNITELSADGQFLARAALETWTDATGIQFVEVGGVAEITFQDSDSGAYAFSSVSGGTISSSTVNVSLDWIENYGAGLNSYSFQTYIHEIGHALGLGHGGNYNGSAGYPNDASYANDSWATTIMSYFSQNENTYFANQGFDYNFVLTPMAGDIAAVEALYGLSSSTRLGNTVYGFNSTSDRDIHDATQFVSIAYTIVDSGGNDTLDYSGFTQDQVINLNPETFMNIGGETGNVVIGRGTVIENAFGGSGADTIDGNQANNGIQGNDGNDTVNGRGGDDTIYGQAGSDSLYGNGGNDSLFGGDDRDYLYGGNDADSAYGGSGNDVVIGNYGDDTLNGGVGDDLIFAGYGNDTVDGGDGRDTMRGGFGTDTLSGGQGTDAIYGGAGDDTLYGGTGQDFLYGGNGADFLSGGAQDDRLEGDEGDDRLDGNDGNDNVLGGGGNDVVIGGTGDDLLRGGSGNDFLRGGNGSDNLGGGAGADRLTGGAGNDIVTGGTGADEFAFIAMGTGNADTITDFSVADDTIVFDGSIFGALNAGVLAAGAFRIGNSAQDANDRIIYNNNTGELFYDSDGAGGAEQKLVAQLSAGLALTNADFFTESGAANAGLADIKQDYNLAAMPEFIFA